MKIRLWWLLLALTVLGCAGDDDDAADDDAGDDDSGDDDTADDDTSDDDVADDDAGPSRSFRLAACPMQYEVGLWSVDTVFDTAGFDGLIDLLSVHNDFFGVPWDEFAANEEPPAAWLAVMTDIKDQVDSLGVGVFLSVTALDGWRTTLADRARDEDGELVLDEQWADACFDFDSSPDAGKWRAAYQNYVRWMVDYFEPEYLTNMIEMNLFGAACPGQYEALIDLANEVYDQEKAAHPNLAIFPSFVASEYWLLDEGEPCGPPTGEPPTDHSCFEAALARDAGIKRDRYGVSSYPAYFAQYWVGGLPDDYYSAFTDYTGERVVFTEIGVGSREVNAPYPTPDDPCLTILTETEETQREFLQFLFTEAQQLDSDLLTWWSLRDYLPAGMPGTCPCNESPAWCVLYDAMADAGMLPLWLMWGSMGIVNHAGAPKASFDVWEEWLARPVQD